MDERSQALLDLRGMIAQAAPYLPDLLRSDWEFDGLSLMGTLARLMAPTEDILGPALLAWNHVEIKKEG